MSVPTNIFNNYSMAPITSGGSFRESKPTASGARVPGLRKSANNQSTKQQPSSKQAVGLPSFRIKTQLRKRLQRVIVVDGATQFQKDGVEGNRGSMKDGAEAFVLFLRGAQLVLRSSVFTVLNLDEVNVSLDNAEIFGSVLFGEGGSAGGGWRCC